MKPGNLRKQGAKSCGIPEDEGMLWRHLFFERLFFCRNSERRKDIKCQTYLFTSESVTEGDPDKISIDSDAVLDAISVRILMGVSLVKLRSLPA